MTASLDPFFPAAAARPGPAAVREIMRALLEKHADDHAGRWRVAVDRIAPPLPAPGGRSGAIDVVTVADGLRRAVPVLAVGVVEARCPDNEWLSLSSVVACPTLEEVCVIETGGRLARRWTRPRRAWDVRASWGTGGAVAVMDAPDLAEAAPLAPAWHPPTTVEGEDALAFSSIAFSIPLARMLQIAALVAPVAP
ncbi:hypothetical protein [Caenispirillum bisanense]|uniref:Uncharacterized protein n=1 Tax=Caenispirillum bisanense TaxID=414052 RepID=A0A286GHY7_9PROT|nr:hypothetical protein [Caenispirillum bisanense]SOD94594.1 hypothetical protein SAMN05421508_10446 [Caenispirillum bisanense]